MILCPLDLKMTFCDNANKGRLGMVSISNKEDTTTHITNVQMVQANVKCSTQCTHNQKMYVFNDGDGFFRIRPCAMENQFKPLVQHDKARDMRNAVINQNLETSLCNFHGLASYRELIQQDRILKNIMEPLLTGFKSVMRAWSSSVLDRLIIAFLNFISDLPTQIIPNECKEKLKSYLQNSWFSYPWKEAMSAEILFHLHPDVRSSPLAKTNNITERKFKEIDILRTQNKITDAFMILAWASPFNLAKQGKILTTLHSGPFQSTTFNGTPTKRAPHNAGKRRVGGPSLENRYSLTQQNCNCVDPYVPKVEFPSNARGRHCGRKRTRTATLGTNICKLQEQAINKLENKMNETGEGTENEPKLKRRSVATNKKVNSTEVTMVCSHCMQEGIGNPFIASTQKMSNDHISRSHATFICGLCFSEMGTFIKFSSKIKLDSHVAESHNKN